MEINESAFPYLPVPCDKSSWPSGPWKDEPDQIAWTDAFDYHLAMIRHSHLGTWCGYVQPPKSHPLFGLSYNSRAAMPKAWLERKINLGEDMGVLSAFCAPLNMNEAMSEATLDLIFLCHGGLTYGQKGWLGFDCGHSGDLMPNLSSVSGGIYRDATYVRANCERLAQQLRDYIEALPR